MRASAVPIGRVRLLRGVRSWLPLRIVVLGLIALALAKVQVWMRNQVRTVAFDLSRVQRIHDDLLHRRREVQIQLETERDPNLLRRRAMEHLGMVEPRPGQVVDVLVPAGTGPLAASR
jgi:cell division protein FtsL